jgi:hypothetical protein
MHSPLTKIQNPWEKILLCKNPLEKALEIAPVADSKFEFAL